MVKLICPRCDAEQTEKVADSPLKGKWEVYRCAKCNYVWRSTENLKGITKLTKQMVDHAAPVVP
ncbi:non-oxidative hydroxyarylic acid decarboxylases subunit D [Thermodesulfobacteriota bacterium]